MNGEARFERFVMRRFEKGLRTGRILPPLIFVMLMLDFAFAAVMRLVDKKDYPTYGEALWFATQTVTTVGYGDVAPTTSVGRFFASVMMLTGFAFLSVITGIVASSLVARTSGRPHAPGEYEGLERRIAELEGD
jgi:sorbitol-specific phosphotransferase system component IIC